MQCTNKQTCLLIIKLAITQSIFVVWLVTEFWIGNSPIYVDNAEEMLYPWKNNSFFLPIIMTHAITFIIGLTGNIIVISTMSRGHGERSVTRLDF